MNASIPGVPPEAKAIQWLYRRLDAIGAVWIALGMGVLFAVAAQIHSTVDFRTRRARLIERITAERRAQDAAVAVLDFADEVAVRAARELSSGLPAPAPAASVATGLDLAALDALLHKPGLYLRAVDRELRGPRDVHAAAVVSRKDSVVACLLMPPDDASPIALHRAAIRYRWRVDLDDRSPHVHDFEVLDRGLRPASAGFLSEVRRVDERRALALLEREYEGRGRLPRGRAVEAARASWILLAIDELPVGMRMAEGPDIVEALRESWLPQVVAWPHVMRLVLLDVQTGRGPQVLAQVQTAVAARELASAVPNVNADAEEIHGCQAAVALRRAVAAQAQ